MTRLAQLLGLLLLCHYASGGEPRESEAKSDDTLCAELMARVAVIIADGNVTAAVLSPPAFKRDQQVIDRLITLAGHHESLDLTDLAIDGYREAQTRIHALYGVNTLRQLKVIDRLTALYAATGRFDQADHTENLRFSLISRHYGPRSELMLNATYRLASWQFLRGAHTQALFTFEDGLETIDHMMASTDSPRLQLIRRTFEMAADEAALHMYASWDQAAASGR